MAGSYSAGGSLSLADLLDEHGEQIYFDLHRYAGGLNLVSALQEGSEYSPRQLLMLIFNLPADCATMASIRGSQDFRGWGIAEYEMASLIDAVRENTYVLLASNSKRKPEKPQPTYRPKEDTPQKKPNSFAAMAASFFNAATKESS